MRAETITEGLCFGEGPRWHREQLWFSDMHAHTVMRLNEDGAAEPVLEVPLQPSGLGWLPDGDLLVVSMIDRRVLRWDGTKLRTHADLSALAGFHCNDMVVGADGTAYVGNFGFDLHARAEMKPAELIRVTPDGHAEIAANELMFPNGTVITPDGATLIVAESFGGRLTAFDIGPGGSLGRRRVWATLPEGAVPDGICLDEAGGIWSASPTSNECVRQLEGGEVTHRITLDQGAFACMLGGASGRTLYILTARSSDPETCRLERSGRVEAVQAPHARAGRP